MSADVAELGWEIGSGHRLAWLVDQADDVIEAVMGPGELDLIWNHPECGPEGYGWGRIDVTSGNAHRIIDGGRGDEANLTIRASVLCPDCGAHGWVTRGRWVQA